MAMTQNEKRQANLDKLMMSVRRQVDREESNFPDKELDRTKNNLIKNAQSLYTKNEIETFLEKERTRRFDEKRAEVLAKRPEQEAANPLGARTGRATMKKGGGTLLKGNQKEIDANKDGKISGEDFKLLQDVEKRNPKFLGGLIKSIKNKLKSSGGGTGSEDAQMFLTSLPSYPNQVSMQRPMFAEGGDVKNQMEMMLGEEKEMPMLPDEEMEEDYVDYVVEETLSNEDRNYLIDALEKDDKLSEIFDQVVESATEFTGSGTVEGPGTGKSDSIPARLSDGEFVFTTKATEEIGADNLMSMMKDAEAAVDERQQLANGGSPMAREEREVMVAPQEPIQQNINVTKSTLDNSAAMPRQEEDNVRKAINENMMLDPYQKHVRS